MGSVTDIDFAVGMSGQLMVMTNSGFGGGDVTLSVAVDGGSISYTVKVPRPTAAPIPASLVLLGPVLATLGVARVTNRRTGRLKR